MTGRHQSDFTSMIAQRTLSSLLCFLILVSTLSACADFDEDINGEKSSSTDLNSTYENSISPGEETMEEDKIAIIGDYLFGNWNDKDKKGFVIIDSYEELQDIYKYIKDSDYYTLRQGEGAYTDYLSGKYDSAYFSAGGRLVAIPKHSSSGSYTYYTYSEKTGDRLTIYLRRRNAYITMSTDDLGYFIYLEPIGPEYDESSIEIVRDDSTSVTNDAIIKNASDTMFASISSGNYTRYDAQGYCTEAFTALNWAKIYEDNIYESGGWIDADGYFLPEEAISHNREKIPVIKAAGGMELFFAEGINVTKTKFFVLDIGLESEKEIGSLKEIEGLPEGVYYIVCHVTTQGRTIDGITETSQYYCIFLLDVTKSHL